MVPKYANKLKERQLNNKTGSVWAIQNVPPTWRNEVKETVEADNYYFDTDGTAYPIPVNELEDNQEEE